MNKNTRWVRVKFHADSNLVKIRHVNSDSLPCVWKTSLKKDAYTATKRPFPTCSGRRPNGRSKKGGAKGSVSLWKESTQVGCVSQSSYPRYFYLTTPSNSLKATGNKTKFGKDEVLLKCAAHDCSLHSPKFEDRSHEETLTHERWASKAMWVWAKSIYKLKEHVYVFVEEGKSTPIASERPEEREFVVASRASRKNNNSAQKNYW